MNFLLGILIFLLLGSLDETRSFDEVFEITKEKQKMLKAIPSIHASFIKERISNPERIYGKGFGESKLKNKCECEGSKIVPCTEEEHQENRRTEFLIINM